MTLRSFGDCTRSKVGNAESKPVAGSATSMAVEVNAMGFTKWNEHHKMAITAPQAFYRLQLQQARTSSQ